MLSSPYQMILFYFAVVPLSSSWMIMAFRPQHHRMMTGSTSSGGRHSTTTELSMIRLPSVIGRFRKKRQIDDQKRVPINIGEAIPDVDVEWIRSTTTTTTTSSVESTTSTTITSTPISILDVIGTKKSLVIGMPGAFTPTCTKQHLPGYMEIASKFQTYGNIDHIVIVTTNDRYVNEEWCLQLGLLSPNSTVIISDDADTIDHNNENNDIIRIVSDGDGDFVKSIGLADDMGFGVGIRSKRFVCVTDNGKVTALYTDQGMNDCSMTSAPYVFQQLVPNYKELVTNGDEESSLNPIVVAGSAIVIGLTIFASSLFSGGSSSSSSSSSYTPPPPASSSSSVIKSSSNTNNKNNDFTLLKEYSTAK